MISMAGPSLNISPTPSLLLSRPSATTSEDTNTSQAIPGIGHNGGPSLNPNLRPFWATPARHRILYGGRSSSKSWDAAGFVIFLSTQVRIRVLCARQFQNKIEESVYTLLKVQIERFGLGAQFVVTKNSIRNTVTGSEFLFYGLWRHIDEIKSLEGIDICWIEEAHNLTEAQWEILEPTLKKEGSQFWIIFNPRLSNDFVFKRFVTNPPPDTVKRHINYDENPFLSQTMLRAIRAKRLDDEEDYEYIYLGIPRDDDDSVIIKRSWILASIDAHIALGIPASGARRVGFDVADSGDDKCAETAMHGFVCHHIGEWKAREDELLKSATRVYSLAEELGASIDYDSIGVGAFAGAHFQALNQARKQRILYYRFNAGGEVIKPDSRIDPKDARSATNRDYYSNLKAQAWWGVAKRFRNTYNAVKHGHSYAPDEIISISSRCDAKLLDKLIDELSTPRRDFDNNGKVKVESKKDLAKTNRPGGPVPSPNLADSFVSANSPRGAAPLQISDATLERARRRI